MMVLVSQTTAVLTSGLERIPDQLGYLVISEDGVLAVSADYVCLQNQTSVLVRSICTRLQVTSIVLYCGVT